MKEHRSIHSGFTVLELLVVVSVLGLLSGLLGPGLARAASSARGVNCLGNLRNWGQATHAYATDNADLLPLDGAGNGHSTRSAWYADLPPQLGQRPYHEQGGWRTNPVPPLPRNVWLCPANERRSDGRMLFHYTLNRLVNGSGDDARQIPLGSVLEPARTVWLFDNGKKAAVAQAGNVHRTVHRNGANFLFLDGHAARFGDDAYWDVIRNRPFTDHPALRWSGRDELR